MNNLNPTRSFIRSHRDLFDTRVGSIPEFLRQTVISAAKKTKETKDEYKEKQ